MAETAGHYRRVRSPKRRELLDRIAGRRGIVCGPGTLSWGVPCGTGCGTSCAVGVDGARFDAGARSASLGRLERWAIPPQQQHSCSFDHLVGAGDDKYSRIFAKS
jgi:hypothetical protein